MHQPNAVVHPYFAQQSHINPQPKRPRSPPPPPPQTYVEYQHTNEPNDYGLGQQDETAGEDEEIDALETQDEFIQAIKKWVAQDNQLRILNAREKEARDHRQFLTRQIHRFVEDNGLEYPTIDVGGDGELIICEKREYSALSFSYIHKCLSGLIKEPAHVDRILHALRENREYFIVPDIRRSK